MIYLLSAPFIIAYILLAWFDSHAFIEYAQLFKLHKFIPIIKKYSEIKDSGSPLNFNEYLGQYYSQYFIVKIITCNICLTPWLSAIILGILSFFAIDYRLALILWLPLAYISLLLHKIQKRL